MLYEVITQNSLRDACTLFDSEAAQDASRPCSTVLAELLQNRVGNSVYLSEFELQEIYRQSSLKVQVKYLKAATNDFMPADSLITDEEIKNYFNENPNDFPKSAEQSRITSYNVCYTKLLRGTFFNWYDNGKMKSEENYKDDIKDGRFMTYDKEGNIIEEKYFKDGKEVSKKES